MIALVRFLLVIFVVSTFFLNLTWRQRVIAIGAAVMVALLSTILVVTFNLDNTGTVQEAVDRQVPPTSTAPPREPDGPSFSTACRGFRLLVDDIEAEKLGEISERQARANEVLRNADFPGSPSSFRELITTYLSAVEERFAMTEVDAEFDVREIDRRIRRARDDVFSGCRARGD